MSAAPPSVHSQRMVASVYGWRAYQSWCDCCTPNATEQKNSVAKSGLRSRSQPASPVLAWRVRLKTQVASTGTDESTFA